MATYTMQLRELIEHYSQDDENLKTRERIEIGRKELFDFDYPIFDDDYKPIFERNFIRNFYMREIGFETEGLFQFQLETWLLINMPYFNKLFESELIQFNPLESYNLKTTYQRVNDTIQDDESNRTQTDDKTLKQTDNNLTTSSDSEINKNDNTVSITQNENRDVTQSDNKNTSQNVDETKLSKGDVKSEYDETTSENSVTNTLNENVNESETNTDEKSKNTSQKDVDNFNRNLESDTPDTRLQITSQNGNGVIEYASKITENKEIAKDKTTNDSESESNVFATSATTDETSQETDKTVSTEGHNNNTSLNTDEINSRLIGNESINSRIDDDKQINVNELTKLNETKQRNQSNTVKNETNLTDKNTSIANQTLNSKINNIEDYIENKVGSIGVKTYSQMIEEYRSILLRIEKQIFNEMSELFMLVY